MPYLLGRNLRLSEAIYDSNNNDDNDNVTPLLSHTLTLSHIVAYGPLIHCSQH